MFITVELVHYCRNIKLMGVKIVSTWFSKEMTFTQGDFLDNVRYSILHFLKN